MEFVAARLLHVQNDATARSDSSCKYILWRTCSRPDIYMESDSIVLAFKATCAVVGSICFLADDEDSDNSDDDEDEDEDTDSDEEEDDADDSDGED